MKQKKEETQVKEYIKGVNMGESREAAGGAQQEAMEDGEDAQQEVMEYETDREGTNALLRANEEDFIHGLIDSAAFISKETQRIEIIREGRLFFAFRIRPLSAAEYEKCREKHTRYLRNKQLGIKLPDKTNRIKYQSAIIYEATVEEDRKKLWDNRKVWDALNAVQDRIMNGLDVIDCTLKAGEKDKVLEAIDRLSGFSENVEEVESGSLEELAKN